ncbi:helix-turn-helix domain-containing protein [Bacillus sp. Marseille-P3661]|uniref:helix-turn-helix domain-containing protein n=1 Tax=Bacillus sp. Marseille-P3661 TaxID=1936234 RepID=UPI000C8215C4|nr:helix-turn-helix transcriptional regulator [Bacillus sp. Marseille-P3661]
MKNEQNDIEKKKKEFGERLRMARLVHNLTAEEAAVQNGITKGALSRYENGLREPSYKTIEKLAAFYKVSTDFLVTGELFLTHPDQTFLDLESGQMISKGKEEFEISRRLLIEKVKTVVEKNIQDMDPLTLAGLLRLDRDMLTSLSYLLRTFSSSNLLFVKLSHFQGKDVDDLLILLDNVEKQNKGDTQLDIF